MLFPKYNVSVPMWILHGSYRSLTTVIIVTIKVVHFQESIFYISQIIIIPLHRISVTEMAGRDLNWSRGLNLSRSQSLLNVRSGHESAPAEGQSGSSSHSQTALPTSSEEGGLELLGSAATSEDFEPASCHDEVDTNYWIMTVTLQEMQMKFRRR
jgi:hypothetical protein